MIGKEKAEKVVEAKAARGRAEIAAQEARDADTKAENTAELAQTARKKAKARAKTVKVKLRGISQLHSIELYLPIQCKKRDGRNSTAGNSTQKFLSAQLHANPVLLFNQSLYYFFPPAYYECGVTCDSDSDNCFVYRK